MSTIISLTFLTFLSVTACNFGRVWAPEAVEQARSISWLESLDGVKCDLNQALVLLGLSFAYVSSFH